MTQSLSSWSRHSSGEELDDKEIDVRPMVYAMKSTQADSGTENGGAAGKDGEDGGGQGEETIEQRPVAGRKRFSRDNSEGKR